MVDFLVIGSVLSVTYIESFDLVIQKRKMIGYNKVSDFIGGDKKFGNICWITSMRDDCPPPLVLKKDYRLDDYKRFDERPDIINIDRISDIPSDYYDVMGVPVTFIEKWNPGQFDIVGMVYWHMILDEKGHKIKKMRLLIRRRKNGRFSDYRQRYFSR